MIKTAQQLRPAYAGTSHLEGSAILLLLNFSPLEFDDAEIEASLFPYGADGEEVLKKQRQEQF